jgi:hypothetical protein
LDLAGYHLSCIKLCAVTTAQEVVGRGHLQTTTLSLVKSSLAQKAIIVGEIFSYMLYLTKLVDYSHHTPAQDWKLTDTQKSFLRDTFMPALCAQWPSPDINPEKAFSWCNSLYSCDIFQQLVVRDVLATMAVVEGNTNPTSHLIRGLYQDVRALLLE